MKIRFLLLAALCVVGLAASGAAAAQVSRAAEGDPRARTALELMPAHAKLIVTSPAFRAGEVIPFEYTQYRSNAFPGLTWSGGPAGTKSYVIIMQDSTLLLRGAPILHWTMFNIPAEFTGLPTRMSPDERPPGSEYGPNYKGAAMPYTGPRTPPGPGDDYHFQVFALDRTVPSAASSSYEALSEAMRGHVLAAGEIVGRGVFDSEAQPRPRRPAATQ